MEWVGGSYDDARLEITVLDAGGGGRIVTVRLAEYGHLDLDHGYAATVHKTQGGTVDRHMAYVALTRHRDGVALHCSADELGSQEGLARTRRLDQANRDKPQGRSITHRCPALATQPVY